jgi:NADP+-dependent farnesol dehydrogenase
MERWIGKIAVVTGASAGIGYAILKELAGRGMIVVGLARRDESIKDLAKSEKGVIHVIKCDLSDETQIIEAFQWVEKNLGGVDLLVNNAGVIPLSTLSGRNC